MARTDLPLDELLRYRAEVAEPVDFDAFWGQTLDEAAAVDVDLRWEAVDTPFRTVRIYDASFRGFAGDRVDAWLLTPSGEDVARPAVVEFIGYNGGRDLPGNALQWASAGYVHLLVDTRGQGAVRGGGGTTADPHGSGPHAPGFVTMGIERPEDYYYYRRVFTDSVRAVEAVRALPGVRREAVAVQGISQGGGISLALAGLVPDLAAVMPDVPFLYHFRRAVEVCDRDPYTEITRYISVHRDAADRVWETLSYVDGVNFAKRALAPALFSVALMDKTCPPSTVYAAFHAYGGAKEIEIYPYNDHEGGLMHQRLAQINWLDRLLDRPEPRPELSSRP